jgi:hypothetical protein
MFAIKLTPAQRSAVEIYVTDPVHAEDYPEASLHGSILHLDSSYERAADILIEASNSADVGAREGQQRDHGAVKALDNVLGKLRKLRPS